MGVMNRGYAGVEYEGDQMSEDEGVATTKRLLEAAREKLTSEFEQYVACTAIIRRCTR